MKNKTNCESFGNLKTQTPSFELLLQQHTCSRFSCPLVTSRKTTPQIIEIAEMLKSKTVDQLKQQCLKLDNLRF